MSTYPATFISGKKLVSPSFLSHMYWSHSQTILPNETTYIQSWLSPSSVCVLSRVRIALHLYTHAHMCTATPTTSHCHCNARCARIQALPPHPAASSSGMTTCCNSLKATSTQSGSYTSCMASWDSTVSLDTLYGSYCK